MIEAVLMLAGIRLEQMPGSGCAFRFTGGELLPLFGDGDGFQTPTMVGSPMALGTMAFPSTGPGPGPLETAVNPCYLLVPPPSPKLTQIP